MFVVGMSRVHYSRAYGFNELVVEVLGVLRSLQSRTRLSSGCHGCDHPRDGYVTLFL